MVFLHFWICYLIRIEMEVEVMNFLMDQKFKLVMEPDKVTGCLGRLENRLETLNKRRNVSKIKMQTYLI